MFNFLKKHKKILSIVIGVALVTGVFAFKPHTANASITLVQTKGQGNGYVNSYTIAFTSNVTAGDLLLFSVTAGNADTVASLTDNQSDTITLAKSSINAASGDRETLLYYVASAVGGATTFTMTWTSGQFNDAATIIREYSGLTSTPLDVTSANNDSTTNNTTHDAGTTAATANANELVVLTGGCANTNSPGSAAGTGYGNGLEQKGSDSFTFGFMSDKTVSSTGTQSGNFTTTSACQGQALIATFKAPASTLPAEQTTQFNLGGD